MSMTITRGSKALKFKAFKAGWILAGMKTATLRLFDDKDLQVADKLDLINILGFKDIVNFYLAKKLITKEEYQKSLQYGKFAKDFALK